ncbi:HET-domain-containing protein [Dichomitus squalens]|uniref:HET-domain-containing protein n=1 Tax=Dichomitus squalens TaxID=114155 RepID=A0A4Q9MC65_9APHY|nr:HET-domain-containing protein [Dichomitus squalens]
MWLLSTDRAELRYFSRNFDADGGYAILSHTWEGSEQTFQHVRAIGERCRLAGTNPRDDPELSPKIRECCILAERYGYDWAWVDSCCIDKSSSSELSEALNSMYRWYSDAEVCYAYLADVPDGCVLDAPNSPFRKSRWHTRGWTLQELIAPAFLVFLSQEWHELGDRGSLANLLQQITRIPALIFTRETRPADYSVAVRMHWASRRKTAREEDEAYCLMGLFGVSLPTNYGEGEKAFLRLQYEIMRNIPDTSIFAFGYKVPHSELDQQGFALKPDPRARLTSRSQCLLAFSPRQFNIEASYTPERGANIRGAQPGGDQIADTSPFGAVELPRISVTSNEVELRLPVVDIDGISVAVLLCEDADGHLGLLLTRDPRAIDSTRPRYYTGIESRRSDSGPGNRVRLATLGRDLNHLRFNGKRIEAKWRTIYIVPSPPEWLSPGSTNAQLTINCTSGSPFRLPHWLVSRFVALQFRVWEDIRTPEFVRMTIMRTRRAERIWLDLGQCQRDTGAPPRHWSKVTISHESNYMRHTTVSQSHTCSEHHIDSWPAWSKDFGDADRTVRLSFTPCKRSPETTRVVHIELFGRVYAEMLLEANVSFPSPDGRHKGMQLVQT